MVVGGGGGRPLEATGGQFPRTDFDIASEIKSSNAPRTPKGTLVWELIDK